MAAGDSVFTRLRKLKPRQGLTDSARLMREVVRARLLASTPGDTALPAAFHLDARHSIEQLESVDMVRRLRRANLVGILMWPPFVVLDLIVSHRQPDVLPWLIALRAAAWAICVTMFIALSRVHSPTSWVIPVARVPAFAAGCVLITLKCVLIGGVENRYANGIILTMIVRAAFVAEPWRASLLPYALMWLAFPATILIAAPFSAMLTAQLHDPKALGIFVTQNVISLGAALTGIASCHGMWRLRREAYEARNLGRYRLKERIGRGGMGEIWVADHMGLRQEVALKVLTARGIADREAVARFEREVLAISRLSHPNTVRILDHGVTPDGIWFYAMELLHGLDLAALLQREGPLPPARATDFMIQTCAALAEAHRSGVVHRDLKPGNIFVATVAGQADVIKLLDFGLAKLTLEPDAAPLTKDSSVLGTPIYMAPETLGSGRHVDTRSDVYGLGCVLYEMLAGRPPFEDTSWPNLLRQIAEEVPESPSHKLGAPLPAELEAIALRCLEKKPDDRFRDAAELGAALAALHS
jgi:serine/threonine-protein kinase